jgi:hypothetical protein
MAIIDLSEIGLFFTIKKKLRKPTDVNPLKPNSRANAYPLLVPGVYKSHMKNGKLVTWRCALYSPVNNKTPNQLAWQAIYRAGVAEWKNLTKEQQQIYNRKAYGKHMSGYNVFMKEYLIANYPPPVTYGCVLQQNDGYVLQQNGAKIKI